MSMGVDEDLASHEKDDQRKNSNPVI
jgi:hypothetical protein